MNFISGYEWQYITMLGSMVILIVGFITSRKLPQKRKKSQIQKFACAALIPLALMLLFTKPYVSFTPKTSFLFREQKAENLTSVEELAKYEKDQTKNIELLREDVENLRKELDEVNTYYGGLVQLLVTITITFCLIHIMKKEESLEETDKTI